MEPKNLENRKCHEILTLVTSEGIIFNEFSSLTRVSLLCGTHVAYYYISRRAVLPKSNTGTGQNPATMTIENFCIFQSYGSFRFVGLEY